MTAILTYILKWALSLAALYLPFALMLRRETFATLNRRLLLCIIIASAVLPGIVVTYPVEIELPSTTPSVITATTENTHTAATNITTSIKEIATTRNIFIIYCTGVALSAVAWSISLIGAIHSIRRGTIWIDRRKRMTIHCHADDTAPFSLFSSVVISQRDYDEYGREILLHEEGHIKHRHSYDMLLISLVKALQWFNPFIYLMANDIKEIHEYEADRFVLQHNGNTQAYQMLILKKAIGNNLFPLTNNFSQSCVRKRIKMMSRRESSNSQRCKWLYLLPVSAAYIGAFAQPEYIYTTATGTTAPGTPPQQQETNDEEHTATNINCRPANGKASIAYRQTAPLQVPSAIAPIEPPVIKEEKLLANSYCEYIDLDSSITGRTLKSSGMRKCDMKVRFTTNKDGKASNISIGSCNVCIPGNPSTADIERIKAAAATATIKHITAKQWHTGQKTQYDAQIIYHYGPALEIAGNSARLPLMAGATAIR